MGGVCSCRGRDSQVNAGSILDRVISQASNEDQCLLYRLANYKKGGELIEAYTRGGQPEVERLMREQFGILMYADGKGQSINRAEYLRWKFRDLDQVVLPIEASLSRFDPLAQWNDHDACWQMQYRGSLGETLLHVLIICDTRMHTRIARILLKCFPRLAIDVVEGEEYLGAGALHLAIAYANNELVQDLVEAGAMVSQRAIGSFFLPRDQQLQRPARNTDYEGLAYLGEYPLAWAACCANESVYNLLLDSGADPDEQDTFGNMILHMVVVCDKLDMFGYALRHPKLPARNGIANSAGLTPLTLACQLGRAEVFREMLELSAREFWRYSNITCSAYPLNALDTLLPDGRTNWNSALFIILNGTKEEHLDMLDGGIIQRLLEEKWKTFARLQFLKRLIILVFHLTSLSLAVYLRPADVEVDLFAWPEEFIDVGRTIAEYVTVIGVLSYILVQLGGEVVNIGLISFLKQLSHEPAKFIFLISNLLILACIPCRIAGDRHAEDAILVVAVPGSWFLLMFFAGAVRLTGPFVTMVYSMITGDMLTFGIIYMVVLFGFSQSFYFLYKGFPGVKSSLYHSYHSTWMALFQITLGDYTYSDLSYTTYPNLSKTVFAIFMVLVPILLLNMLIAMMGNTYAHVIEQSEKEWMKQWAKIVVSLERAVSQKDAHNYLQEYSIKLGPGDDPNNPASEQRGVMVIKSKSKTRARQRKGAVANWKRVGKVTINELRKRGMTGEELRCIMWGRASFSTPVRASPNIGELEMGATSGVTGGFGDALTAALDVMVFAHDIDLTTATEGIPTTDSAAKAAKSQHYQQHQHQQPQTKVASSSSTSVPQPPIPKSSSTCLQTTPSQNHDLAQSKISGLTETTETRLEVTGVVSTKIVVPTNGNPISEKAHQPQKQKHPSSINETFGNGQLEANQVRSSGEAFIAKRQTETENPDPLLDLVIASESPSSQHTILQRMAAEAARISCEAETASTTATTAPNMTLQNSQILEKLSGLGAVIPDSMLPSRNPQLPKPPIEKKYFAEFSDNDLCGNDSLLGTEARLRRIRSASLRLSSSASRKRSCQANNDEKYFDDVLSSSSPSMDECEYYTNRPMTNGMEFLNEASGNGQKPSSILAKELESELTAVTTTTTTTTTRNGTATIVSRENGCNERVNKNHKRRAKTAKNRVSPKDSNEMMERKKREMSSDSRSSRRKNENTENVGDETSSPTSDPLEPWSTRASMKNRVSEKKLGCVFHDIVKCNEKLSLSSNDMNKGILQQHLDEVGPMCIDVENGDLDPDEMRSIVHQHNVHRNNIARGLEIRGNPGPQPPARNIMELTWDDELARIARRWAIQCIPLEKDFCRDVERFAVWQNVNIASLDTTNDPIDEDPVDNRDSSVEEDANSTVTASPFMRIPFHVQSWLDEVEHFDAATAGLVDFAMENETSYLAIAGAMITRVGCGRAMYRAYLDESVDEFEVVMLHPEATDNKNERGTSTRVEVLVCNYGPIDRTAPQNLYEYGTPQQCPEGTIPSYEYDHLCARSQEFQGFLPGDMEDRAGEEGTLDSGWQGIVGSSSWQEERSRSISSSAVSIALRKSRDARSSFHALAEFLSLVLLHIITKTPGVHCC